jgi:hypothetical protein
MTSARVWLRVDLRDTLDFPTKVKISQFKSRLKIRYFSQVNNKATAGYNLVD